MDAIERKYGERLFRNVFKTITVDNGVVVYKLLHIIILVQNVPM